MLTQSCLERERRIANEMLRMASHAFLVIFFNFCFLILYDFFIYIFLYFIYVLFSYFIFIYLYIHIFIFFMLYFYSLANIYFQNFDHFHFFQFYSNLVMLKIFFIVFASVLHRYVHTIMRFLFYIFISDYFLFFHCISKKFIEYILGILNFFFSFRIFYYFFLFLQALEVLIIELKKFTHHNEEVYLKLAEKFSTILIFLSTFVRSNAPSDAEIIWYQERQKYLSKGVC